MSDRKTTPDGQPNIDASDHGHVQSPRVTASRGIVGQPHTIDIRRTQGGTHNTTSRRFSLWLTGALLTLLSIMWLSALSIAQITDEKVALPILERTIVTLTDFDRMLDENLNSIQEQADTGALLLAFPGFPIRDANVTITDVTRTDGKIDRTLLRKTLLEKSANLIYTRGIRAFQHEGEPSATTGLSTSGAILALLDGLSRDNHEIAVMWLWPLGGACIVLGILLLAAGTQFVRFLALGLTMILASIPVLAVGIGARIALGSLEISPEDQFLNEFLTIGHQLATLPIRNSMWLGGAGVAIMLPSVFLRAVFERKTQSMEIDRQTSSDLPPEPFSSLDRRSRR